MVTPCGKPCAHSNFILTYSHETGHLTCHPCMKMHARRSNDPYQATCPTCRAPFSIGSGLYMRFHGRLLLMWAPRGCCSHAGPVYHPKEIPRLRLSIPPSRLSSRRWGGFEVRVDREAQHRSCGAQSTRQGAQARQGPLDGSRRRARSRASPRTSATRTWRVTRREKRLAERSGTSRSSEQVRQPQVPVSFLNSTRDRGVVPLSER